MCVVCVRVCVCVCDLISSGSWRSLCSSVTLWSSYSGAARQTARTLWTLCIVHEQSQECTRSNILSNHSETQHNRWSTKYITIMTQSIQQCLHLFSRSNAYLETEELYIAGMSVICTNSIILYNVHSSPFVVL